MNVNKKHPRIAVVMGIYNCSATLRDSIDSLLSQTYTDWELIMCDDASTDNTLSIAREYAEKYDNIRVIHNKTNLGLAASLNHCIENVNKNAEFIARQDGDDISLSNRFAIQIDFLDRHPEFAFVSTAMTRFDDNGIWGEQTRPEIPNKMHFVKSSPFFHAPVMMRRKELAEVGNYTVSKYLRRGQDYYLWHKFYCKGYKGYNIQTSYYSMRDDRDASLRRKFIDRLYGLKIHLEVMRNLKIPFIYYPYALRTIIIGLLPLKIYEKLHRRSVNKTNS